MFDSRELKPRVGRDRIKQLSAHGVFVWVVWKFEEVHASRRGRQLLPRRVKRNLLDAKQGLQKLKPEKWLTRARSDKSEEVGLEKEEIKYEEEQEQEEGGGSRTKSVRFNE